MPRVIPFEYDAYCALIQGDERGLDFFFHKYYAALKCFALSYVHSEATAQDLASEAFVKVWLHRTELRSSAAVKTYLYQVVRNSCIDYLRAEKSRDAYQKRGVEEPTYEETATEKMIRAETYRELYDHLQSLPEQCQKVFCLYCLEEKSHKEIATALGISINTVKSQKQRAQQLLRRKMAKLKQAQLYPLCFIVVFMT